MNSPSPEKNRKKVWSEVEQVADRVEIGVRLLLGVLFAGVLSVAAWGLGSQLWVGLGIAAVIPALLVGFVAGFFWPEIRFLLRLMLKALGVFFINW